MVSDMTKSSPARVFCAIISGEAPASVVCQDARAMAVMTINPVNPGHVLVIPKLHYAYLADVPEHLGAHIFTMGQRVAAAIRRSGVRCEGVNMFLTDGEAAFQEVFHFHLHVFPRSREDEFRIDANWSSYPPRHELDTIAQTIAASYRQDQ